MTRIRTVKPELFRHETLFEVEESSGLPIRLAFIGLFACCDREGRFRWKPRQLKLDILPYDGIDFSEVLDALATAGFIKRYAANGEDYGVIPSWHRHQVINPKEKQSELPDPFLNTSHCVEGAKSEPMPKEMNLTTLLQSDINTKDSSKEDNDLASRGLPEDLTQVHLNRSSAEASLKNISKNNNLTRGSRVAHAWLTR